jgi:5-formyltetrahydrofolate cyclo-ligase
MDKAELRRVPRVDIDPAQSLLVASALYVWLARRLPGTVAAYLAMSGEVDVTSLFGRLPGWRWVLPRVEPDHTLTFRDRDVPYETHKWGMTQPVNSGPVVSLQTLDVILVPGIAFDRSGGRLGRGRGFYDRALAGRRADSETVGVTASQNLVTAVPMSDHDQHVDFLATEEGVSRCSPKN